MSSNDTSAAASEGAAYEGKDQFGMTPEMWARLDAKANDGINAAALADPDAQPIPPERLARMRRISPARFIRQKLGMGVEQFALVYGIPAETLLAWERYETEPSPAEATFLRAIARAPDALREAVREPAE